MTPSAGAARVRSISPHDHSFPALDGLRGMAVGLVLVIHLAFEMREQLGDRAGVTGLLDAVDPLASLGGTGVHLFFVLSGFLLFLPFARHALLGRQWPSTAEFFKRRALRIVPAYYLVTALVVLAFEREAVQAAPVKQVLSHLLLVHNYSADTLKGLNGPTWTMAVESQFYVMLPLLAAVGVACSKRGQRLLLAGMLTLLLVSPAAAVTGAVLRRMDVDATFLTAVSFLGVFGAGMAVAWVWVLQEAGRLSPTVQKTLSRWGGVAFVAIFGGLLLRHALGVSMPAVDYYGFALLMAGCYTGLLLHVLFADSSRTSIALTKPVPRFLGDISYSLYLVHYALIQHVILPFADRAADPFVVPAALLSTVALLLPVATASFWWVERPFLPRRRGAARADSVSDGKTT